MKTTQKAPSLWDKHNPQNSNKQTDLQGLFYNKAFIENFFNDNLLVAKEMLQSSGLLFDSVEIEFSTSNYCYEVIIFVENCKNFYSETLKYNSVRTTPTANLMQAIENSIQLLRNQKRIEPVAPIPTPKPQRKPTAKRNKEATKKTTPKAENKQLEVKQTTLETAIKNNRYEY